METDLKNVPPLPDCKLKGPFPRLAAYWTDGVVPFFFYWHLFLDSPKSQSWCIFLFCYCSIMSMWSTVKYAGHCRGPCSQLDPACIGVLWDWGGRHGIGPLNGLYKLGAGTMYPIFLVVRTRFVCFPTALGWMSQLLSMMLTQCNSYHVICFEVSLRCDFCFRWISW